MSTKITPTLYIGLGGTGARALLRAKMCFIDTYGKVPPMIEFLAIDTDSNIGGEPIKSAIHGDITLSRNETLYISERNAREKYNNFPQEFNWVPSQNVTNLSNIRGDGAGMVRSNGRFILQESQSSVVTAIKGKIDNITQSISLGGEFVPSTRDNGDMYPAIVNVVGSIAGGTGCGMIVDMLQIIPSAIDDKSMGYYIYPWIIMPDIYRSMYPRMSDNVYLNAYGALRELDYLFNLKGNKTPIRLGNGSITILSESVQYAYLINNYNSFAGTILSATDIADNVGRSMFMPTNDMGAAVATPMDNIRNWKPNFDLKAEGKSCWCVSTGSAEIVYDSQIVGDNIGYSIIRSVANQLTQTSDQNQISLLVSQWMLSPEVSIQERNADLLIDSLLKPNYPANIAFDKESTASDIENFITIATNVKEELDKRYKDVSLRVASELGKKLDAILNSAHGVGDALEFLTQLMASIALCEEDMNTEIADHSQRVENHVPWSNALKGITKTTFGFTRIDEEAAEMLAQTISLHISDQRNLLRKQCALNVYANLKEVIDSKQKEITAFRAKIKNLAVMMTDWIEANKQEAAKDSLYRINLYKNSLETGRNSCLDDSFNYVSQNNVTELMSSVNEKALFDKIKPWADCQREVQTAFSRTINQVLEEMPEEEVLQLLQYVKKMSAPMWNINYQGKLRSPKDLIHMFIVGCDNAFDNIILSNGKYSSMFESSDGTLRPYFTSIGGKNKIQILTLSCCAPVYAVGNTTHYESEFNKYNTVQAGYLDQQWHQRMLSEKFQIVPVRVSTGVNPLEYWVKSIVLKLVRYDETNNKYWVKSKEQGLPRKGYRVDLGANREAAFDAFKSMGLYKECKTTIDSMVSSKGKSAVQAQYDIVSEDNYYEEYSIMSESDKQHIEEDIYKVLQDLIDDEINFISEGGLKV